MILVFPEMWWVCHPDPDLMAETLEQVHAEQEMIPLPLLGRAVKVPFRIQWGDRSFSYEVVAI